MSQTKLRELHRELQACQRRLGTEQEQSGDFERVLELAHDLNNQLTAKLMQMALSGSDAPPRLASFCKECLKNP